MQHPSAYEGKPVVVLGLARSGRAVAKLFRSYGADVTANDRKSRESCPEADELEALGVAVFCGEHPDNLIREGVSLVVKNPGIPYSIEPVRKALALGIEVVTEVEVAWFVSRARLAAITGSNGKTTTTTWAGRMLEEAGMPAIVAGNIGKPLCEVCRDAGENDWLVAELSSFQLKGTVSFRPRIACLLNIAETHLDYHGTMDDYIGSKAKLVANQREGDVFVYNDDDPVCREAAASCRGTLFPFSASKELETGAYVARGGPWGQGDRLVLRRPGEQPLPLVAPDELGLPGSHNVENALAAAAIAANAGADLEAIRRSLRSFRGVEHRMEWVRELRSVRFYNDSKATNPVSTIKALEGFPDGSVILLAGGLDRGSAYAELEQPFRGKLKALIAIGETKAKLADVARRAGVGSILPVDGSRPEADAVMREAVGIAWRLAEPGDVVLLSPACASWDMFPTFEHRGSMFKESVHNLVT